ncbi:MAG: hypothetical protein ABJK37_23995 [Paraglaciecola sp.]|uniref:tetratricopeptide repeat protein n=1 Tax=Paraglaciecola sp. TaxID=1920173 RepID=UPI0032983DC4
MRLTLFFMFCWVISANVMASNDDTMRYCNSDCASELQFFKKFAREGSSLAHHALSTMYLLGLATDKNVKVGLRHLNKAVKANEPAAVYQKAYFYHRGIFLEQDTEKALLWYKKATRLKVKGAAEKYALLLSEVASSNDLKVIAASKQLKSPKPTLDQHFDEKVERITISAGLSFKQVLYVAENQACNVNCELIASNSVAVPMIILPRDG